NGDGQAFQQNALGIESPDLPAGGNTKVHAALQYSNGTPYKAPATLIFTSGCYRDGTATFEDEGGNAINQVTTTDGHATIKYIAKGCQNDDDISATVVINHTVLHASGTVTVEPAAVELGRGSGASFEK